MLKLGILGSTAGSILPDFLNLVTNARVVLVLSNKIDAGILQKAECLELPHQFIDPAGLSKVAFDAKIAELFKAAKTDLILLMGYMRILSSNFVDTWSGKILNVHPSLLPAYAGLMDQRVHAAVLQDKMRESGCTVHVVTNEIDAGPILVQKTCQVYSDDSIVTLKARVQALESAALAAAVNLFQTNTR
jgi:phosphoribosylglycinamide formyltransferase-1